MKRSLRSRLQEVDELHGLGYTYKRIAEMTGLSYGTVRVYAHLANRKDCDRKINSFVNSRSCPECGSTIQKVLDGSGETICTSCGLVVKTDEILSPEAELFGRAPEHPLIWNKNLGSDERQVLIQLKKALNLKISSYDLRTDDAYLRDGLAMLAGKLMQHNLDYGETAKIARVLRRRLKQLTSKDKVESVVEQVYNEFFPKGERRG